jgi:isoprenylcysteine carboxyl methyltransferase (ICMT) family protein YpbQ
MSFCKIQKKCPIFLQMAIALTTVVCSYTIVLVVLNVDSNKKGRQGGNIIMGKQHYRVLIIVHIKLIETYKQASYSFLIASGCKLEIVIRPLESTNLEDV